MKIAYPLTLKEIRKNVKKGAPGSYQLGEKMDDKFHVLYVGRSDSCLRRRLLRHARNGTYSFFCFRESKTNKNASVSECINYHSFNGLNNKIHPTKIKMVRCPICQTVDDVRSMMKTNMLRITA